MDFLNELKEETLLIIPNSIKNKVLKYIRSYNPLANVKIVSLDDIKKLLVFDYDSEAVFYLMNKYKYRYEVAKVLIDNMYYVDSNKYVDKKLDELVNIKIELLDNKLLKTDNLFLNKYKNIPVMVFGYDYIDKYNKELLKYFDNIKIIEKDRGNIVDREVYKFKNINDEVSFVMKKIMDLIYEGVDLNKIKITNLNDDYRRIFKRYSRLYNIPISLNDKISIYGTNIVESYLNYLLSGISFEDVLINIEKDFSLVNEKNREIYNRLVNISNKYIDSNYDIELIMEAIKYDLKHSYVKYLHYDKEIEEIDIKNNVFSDEYIFLLGFNQGDIPTIHKDEDYISDSIKDEVSLDKVAILNQLERESLIIFLTSHNNLFISYKLMNGDVECYPSNLIEELGYKTILGEVDNTYTYSDKLSELELAIMLDNLIKYGIKNKELGMLFNSYEIPYLKYDNKFKGIDKKKLIKHLNNEITLSYSAIDNYYKCAFKYYISNILRLDTYEESFVQFIGNLYHYVLSCSKEVDFDFEKEYAFYSQKRECSAIEKFFLLQLKKELLIILDQVREFHSQIDDLNLLCEERIAIDKSIDGINITFKGFVDKILSKEVDGNTLVAVIDYKTGRPELNLFNIIYGLDMQLITYIYLIYKRKLFSNIKFVGVYLQKILDSEVKIERNKTYLELKMDNLKLEGYSIDDMNLIAHIDSSYEDSNYIRGMKLTAKGECGANAKLIDEITLESLINLVDKKIDEARDAILNADFIINPKRIDNKNIGCEYCSYKDICYMMEKDVVSLKGYEDFSFLGGDLNA